ncbi:MAG: CDP-alcohol phosphatidyltransferase family protein [Novosphingobium sp.]
MATAPLRPMRPREMEDALNFHLYHPLAWRLARLLAHTPLTPNMVSIGGAVTVILAGIAYIGPLWGGPAWPVSAALGIALHMAWHVIDGADGDLARMTGRVSPHGEMIDGLCDYLSHVVLYLLLAALLASRIGAGWAWPIAIAAGVAHAVQSNHLEAQRRFYLHWLYAKPWLHNQRAATGGPMAWIAETYLAVAAGLTPHARAIDKAVVAAVDPLRLSALRAIIREESGSLLRFEKLLGPNQRAIVLGLSMLLTASPLGYFVYGGLWLSMLLALSVVLHNRAAQRIAARIAAIPGQATSASSSTIS